MLFLLIILVSLLGFAVSIFLVPVLIAMVPVTIIVITFSTLKKFLKEVWDEANYKTMLK